MNFAGMRVLVVEDEPIVAMGLEDMLEALGCVLAGTASRVAEGLRLAEAAEIDLAVLDINLTGERSDPIATALRARNIPFLFATGYGAPPGDFTEEIYLEKPYRLDQVEAALTMLLDSR